MHSATGEVDKLSSSAHPCRLFSLAEIKSATNDFDDELVIGHGGFGKVYKGQISSEELEHFVAIKRLDAMSNQGEPEFRAEIKMLSKLRHCHLVSLIGYCEYNKEMILVYEYMPHGTLYDHLHKSKIPLNWEQRLKIAIGAGRGLDYLHTGVGTHHGVIHRDVKSSNILLDENWSAMISDFGLSKIGPINQSSSFVVASVKGTFGYLDPECFYTGKLTRKTDVYAFGVVLFELLSGRRAVDDRYGEECSLVRWAQKCVKEGKLNQMIDPNISGTIFPKCLRRFSQIAARCLLTVPNERPTMTEIVASLQALLELQVKAANSADLSGSTGFTRKIQKYFVSKENSDQKGTSSPKGLENNMNEISSTNNDEIIRGLLSVNVYSAKDLTPTVIKRKSDPFVVLTMKKTGTKLRTRVVKDDLNPVWNQTFDFIVEDGLLDMLVVEVYDHATSRKGCMGRCKFTLTRIISERKYEDWFPLDEAKSGKLHLFLNWMAQPNYCDS